MPYKIQEIKDLTPASLKMLNDNIKMLALKVFGSMEFEDLGNKLSSDNFEITKEHARFYGQGGSYSEFVPDSLGMRWHREGGTRYIRNFLGGNTIDNTNKWVEIQAFDKDGNNIALGKPVTMSSAVASGSLSYVTDGNIDPSNYVKSVDCDFDNPTYVEIDLGAIYDIVKIKVWHYYAEGDSWAYFRNWITVSADRETWDTVFNSDYEGTTGESDFGNETLVDLSLDYSILRVQGMANVVGYGSTTTIQLPESFKGRNYTITLGVNYATCSSTNLTALSTILARVLDITDEDKAKGQFRIYSGLLVIDLEASPITTIWNQDLLTLQINFIAMC